MKKILFLLCTVLICNGKSSEGYKKYNIKTTKSLKEAIDQGDVTYVQSYLENKKRRMSIAELEGRYSANTEGIDSEKEEASLIELARLCLLDREKALRMAQNMDPYSQLAMGTTCVAVAVAHVSSNFFCSSQQKDPSGDEMFTNRSRLVSVAQNAMSPLALATVGLKLVFLGVTGLRKTNDRDNAVTIFELFEDTGNKKQTEESEFAIFYQSDSDK